MLLLLFSSDGWEHSALFEFFKAKLPFIKERNAREKDKPVVPKYELISSSIFRCHSISFLLVFYSFSCITLFDRVESPPPSRSPERKARSRSRSPSRRISPSNSPPYRKTSRSRSRSPVRRGRSRSRSPPRRRYIYNIIMAQLQNMNIKSYYYQRRKQQHCYISFFIFKESFLLPFTFKITLRLSFTITITAKKSVTSTSTEPVTSEKT